MKSIVSALLWTVGLVFFMVIFCIVVLGMLLFSTKTIYPAIRMLPRMQLQIMGVKLRTFGLEHIDQKHSYIFMGNHESLFDIFAIPAAFPIYWVGVEAAYHFSLPMFGYLTRKWGNIPIQRKNINQALAALKQAKQVIQSGTSIIILPEGHRTLTGEIGTFKKGPFHLAKEAKADILPFALIGLYEFNNKNSWHLHPRPVSVVFGQPIPYETFKDLAIDTLREHVRNEILQLKRSYH
ncbi:MAG: 1-acyl-sn-glycerol-3-phosphate acyltransferase [Deltaproteobacteria bacterium]|nr:1-acyl-sn-glycerol-3-phosphate acyltransferase [Deltaproteobacteria bacterium]